MEKTVKNARIVKFGVFELDRDAGELRRDGLKVRLQDLPLRILEILLEQPGNLITRDDLQKRLWSADTFVEFDHALNTAVNKLRDALGDTADNPRFLATVPRRGYRFIAPVEEAGFRDGQPPAEGPPKERRSGIAWGKPAAVLGAVVLSTAIFYAGRASRHPGAPVEPPLRRFAVLHDITGAAPVIAPSGERIAFVPADLLYTSEKPIYIQELDEEKPRPLPGTEGAYTAFWSPDSNWLGFFAAGELRVVASEGGSARVVCSTTTPAVGGSWSQDGQSIAFSSGRSQLFVVQARGGVPKPVSLSSSGREVKVMFPAFLPAPFSSQLLLVEADRGAGPEVALCDLRTQEVHALGSGVAPIGWSNGHVLYRNESPGNLLALPFSPRDAQAAGDPFVIAEEVSDASVAGDGTMVYVSSEDLRWRLSWFSRAGERMESIGDSYNRKIVYPAISLDERYILFELGRSPRDIWLLDTVRSVTSRFTTHQGHDTVGIWSRNGAEVYFTSARDGNRDVFLKHMASGKEAVKLVGTPNNDELSDESPDGRTVLYRTQDPERKSDLWYAKRKKDGAGFEHVPFLQTSSSEDGARFSPDGRWVAYWSDESGRDEVYVRRFPDASGVRQISRHGGNQARWSRDGGEIFYVEGQSLMSVPVSLDSDLSIGTPKVLFSNPNLFSRWRVPVYDLGAGGKQFLFPEVMKPSGTKTHIIQNWIDGFRGRQ